MRIKHIILILLIPFSEIKAIFYNVDMRVSWYLFSDHERQLCMVVEDYCNIIIFGVVFWYLYESTKDRIMKQIALFLFILNALDFVHLGLYDMEGWIIAKLLLAYGIFYILWSKLKHSY
jgi:hypothetical protein